VKPELVYKDVNSDWAKEAIYALSSMDVLKGTGNGVFQPKADITRAQIAQLMSNMLTINSGSSLSFDDVNNSQWFSTAIAEVSKEGVFIGYTDGSFKPNQRITRQELAHLMVNTMKWHIEQTGTTLVNPAGSLSLQFKDGGKIAKWALESMEMALSNGLMVGSPDGFLNPEGSATREEAAVMFYRLWQWIDLTSK
jgi:glucosylceramidase